MLQKLRCLVLQHFETLLQDKSDLCLMEEQFSGYLQSPDKLLFTSSQMKMFMSCLLFSRF